MSDRNETRLQTLFNEVQNHGYRLTTARKVVLATLVASEGHVSADELVLQVYRDHNRVGRMTVYRTLDLLSQLGLIRPVFQGTAAAHYVLMDDGHHHHLICSGCDQVIEFDDCALQELDSTLSRHFNFEIQGHLLEVYGRCLDCREPK